MAKQPLPSNSQNKPDLDRNALLEPMLTDNNSGTVVVPILAQENRAPWQPYEDAHWEMPLFSWTGRRFYKFRYALTSVIRKSLFRIGGQEVTVGGLYLLLSFIFLSGLVTFLYYTKDKSGPVKATGYACNFVVILLFSIAGRNSIWSWMFGVSCERLVVWHKVLSLLVLAITGVHGYVAYTTVQTNYTGWGSGGAFLGLTLLIALVRSFGWYRVCCWVHRVGITVIMVFLVLHKASGALIGVGIWGTDLVLRQIWMSFKRRGIRVAHTRTIGSNIVELSFPKDNFKYVAGQFVFVLIPEVSFWEPHPFSISSAPYQSEVTIHIKVLGDWTQALYKLAEKSPKVEIFLEGPYGAPAINFDKPTREAFVFVSGGIGVTPNISYANHLLHQCSRGRKVKKVFFLWSFRNNELIDAFNRKDSYLHHGPKSELLECRFFNSRITPEPSVEEISLGDNSGIQHSKMDLGEQFFRINQYKNEHEIRDLAVMCCGPKEMQSEVSKLCKKYGYAHHIEAFEL